MANDKGGKKAAVDKAVCEIGKLIIPELEQTLENGYHGVLTVSLHVFDGHLAHIKTIKEHTTKLIKSP